MAVVDIDAICKALTAACDHYERSAPTVRDWADDLFIRIGERPQGVTLCELLMVGRLHNADGWLPPALAANRVYHLMERHGQPTTGHAGF